MQYRIRRMAQTQGLLNYSLIKLSLEYQPLIFVPTEATPAFFDGHLVKVTYYF